MPTGAWVFTTVFAVTGAQPVVRLVAGAPGCGRLNSLSHLVMSLGMIAMVHGWTGGSSVLLGIAPAVPFSLAAAGFAYRLRARGDRSATTHLVMNAAMAWMTAAMVVPAAGHGDHSGAGPLGGLVADAVTLLAVGCVAASTYRCAVPPVPGPPIPGPPGTPSPAIGRVDTTCQVLMGIGMSSMLLTMI
ncbi:DUF5134 domain-containing protein [Pseudonocardia sp.]|uniref:DUF5134 domain-containing protein n=1 Tax=Pseudonocardia sp. TaxID=60912 RepID=UPI003D14A5AC